MLLSASYNVASCKQLRAAPINHKPVIIVRIRAIMISTTVLMIKALLDNVLKRVPAQLLRHSRTLILKVTVATVSSMFARPFPIPLPHKRSAERLAVLVVAITVSAGPNARTTNAVSATVCGRDDSGL